MKDNSFLTFNLHGMLFAIDAGAVIGINWLPELTRVEEQHRCITGVINRHGDIVPVMDLLVRFGHNPARYSCTDKVIILGLSGLSIISAEDQCASSGDSGSRINLLGIIVTDVLDVMVIQEKNIEPVIFETGVKNSKPFFVCGEAKSGGKIFMVIDPCKLFDPETLNEKLNADENIIIPEDNAMYFSPEADLNEKEIFHGRAMELLMVSAADYSANLKPAAVFRLNDEYLCVELEAVREFSKIYNFTHIPCCPDHIAGKMNLRGTVLTIIDICGILNLKRCSIIESTKVIVADSGEFPLGVAVDEIIDVIYLKSGDIIPVPGSSEKQNGNFVKGALLYGSGMIALLDLKEILFWDGLVVDEEV